MSKSNKDDPYVQLAHAIIASGIKTNDVSFLKSDWCETLRYLCDLGDNMNYDTPVSSIKSVSTSIYKEYNHV